MRNRTRTEPVQWGSPEEVGARLRLNAKVRGARRITANRPNPNLKAMSIPRIGDILRGEPSLAQSAAASAIRMFQNAMGEYNGQRVRQGQRAIDFPGRYHHPKRVIRPKARSAG